MDAPQEIVRELGLGGALKLVTSQPIRIDAAKNLSDCPILAGRIATLKHDEQSVPSVGV